MRRVATLLPALVAVSAAGLALAPTATAAAPAGGSAYVVSQLESGGDAYATYSAGYPNSGFGTGSWCADMCLLNLCCNPCFSPCC